jgi:hypothetical protein
MAVEAFENDEEGQEKRERNDNTWSRTCQVEARSDLDERGWSSDG